MHKPEIHDPYFKQAVAAIDTGDVFALKCLLESNPELVGTRLEYGEGYFHNPYLLWFVAENPIRNGILPENIIEVTEVILRVLESHAVNLLRKQVDYALELVGSGCVARECGAQDGLIDLLCEHGADPNGAMVPALAQRETAAVERLLGRGAELTLLAAVGLGKTAEAAELMKSASAEDRQVSLICAAFYGRSEILADLVKHDVDLNVHGPSGFHPHATALHQAVYSGCLDAVKVLIEAGANRSIKDLTHQGTSLDWAVHLQRAEIAAFLREGGR